MGNLSNASLPVYFADEDMAAAVKNCYSHLKVGQKIIMELEVVSSDDNECLTIAAVDYINLSTNKSISGVFKVNELTVKTT